MKDSELRTVILKRFYKHRRDEFIELQPEDFGPPIPREDLLSVSDQLAEFGLLDWKAKKHAGKTLRGFGKITASGVDVIENEGRNAPLDFAFPVTQNFTFNSPANVQVGDNNSQEIANHFIAMVERIDASNASPEEKAEAKSRLRAFLEHPLVAAVLGGIAGSILGTLK